MRKDIAVVLIIVAFLGGVVVSRLTMTDKKAKQEQTDRGAKMDAPASVQAATEEVPSPFEGPEFAKVTLMEVSDFQ